MTAEGEGGGTDKGLSLTTPTHTTHTEGVPLTTPTTPETTPTNHETTPTNHETTPTYSETTPTYSEVLVHDALRVEMCKSLQDLKSDTAQLLHNRQEEVRVTEQTGEELHCTKHLHHHKMAALSPGAIC